MNKEEIIEILSGIQCETCEEERKFGDRRNDDPNNKYVYVDLSGVTRCFCKKHMSYGRNGSMALLNYEDKHDYPRYGAILISDIIRDLEENYISKSEVKEKIDIMIKGYDKLIKKYEQEEDG